MNTTNNQQPVLGITVDQLIDSMRQLPDLNDLDMESVVVHIVEADIPNDIESVRVTATVEWNKTPMEDGFIWLAHVAVKPPEGPTYLDRLAAAESELRLLAGAYVKLYEDRYKSDVDEADEAAFEVLYKSYKDEQK